MCMRSCNRNKSFCRIIISYLEGRIIISIFIISSILASLSSLCFGVIANVPKRALIPSCITGGSSWIIYYASNQLIPGLFFPNFFSALCIGIIGTIFSKKVKVPVSMIYVGSIISLVPGGMAFSAIRDFSNTGVLPMLNNIINTIIVAASLATGLGVATTLSNYINKNNNQ